MKNVGLRLKGTAIASVCADLGVSRAGLARQIDASESSLYRLDRGDSSPSARFVAALLHVADEFDFYDLFEVVAEDDQ